MTSLEQSHDFIQRWNPSSDAPPAPPSAAAVDVARGGQGEEFIGSQLALNRKGFYAALCRVAAHMRATDPLPDALADLLRYYAVRGSRILVFIHDSLQLPHTASHVQLGRHTAVQAQ